MNAAPAQTRHAGRKSLDTELNLVPFIDLLSCLISFLLISAVWTKVAAVPARSTGTLATEQPPSEVKSVRITMTARGYLLDVGTGPVEIGRMTRNGRLGWNVKELADRLRQVKHGPDSSVTLEAEDGIAFEDLAETMDQITAAWLPDAPNLTITSAR